MRKGLVVLAAMLVGVASFAVAAPAAPSGQTASDKTIVTVASGDKRFTTLVALVKQAGLVMTLNGKGPFTVFAPTNAAFAKLKAQAPDTFAAVGSDKALLKKVLTYHVVKGKVPAAKVVTLNGKSVKTLSGQSLRVSVRGGNVFLNGSTRVTKTDVLASNGVIHVVNKVLIPKS